MTTTLYLAWRAPESRRWFPVGRLDVEPEGGPARYEFGYIEGVREACEMADFPMVPGFPELDGSYRSEKRFPFFENRLMNHRRPERAEYLRGLGLDPHRWDPVSELAAPFNHAHGNGFEVYPDIVPDGKGTFGPSSWSTDCATPTPTPSSAPSAWRSKRSCGCPLS